MTCIYRATVPQQNKQRVTLCLLPICIHKNHPVTDSVCDICEYQCNTPKTPVPFWIEIPVTEVPVTEVPIPKPSLVDLEATLPPYKEGRDRKLTFEPNGCICYEHSNDETPPRDINGYKRDPNNPFRFIPLWPECLLRHGMGVRYTNCGCIDVIMRCNNPDAIQFGDRVGHEQCCVCQWRKA